MRKKYVAFAVLGATLLLWTGCTRTRRPVEGEKVLRHTVEPGETLEEIADDYYGSPKRARDIARFNELSGGALTPGAVIRVPMTPEEMEVLHRREQARAPYNEGLDLAARGSYADAAQFFQRALALDERFADAWFNLGLTHQRMNVMGKAIDEYREAVHLRPDNVEYRFALGGAWYLEKRYRDAISSFEKALEIDPTHRKSQYSLALAWEKTGNRVRARQAWERYLELDSTSEWAAVAREHLESLE